MTWLISSTAGVLLNMFPVVTVETPHYKADSFRSQTKQTLGALGFYSDQSIAPVICIHRADSCCRLLIPKCHLSPEIAQPYIVLIHPLAGLAGVSNSMSSGLSHFWAWLRVPDSCLPQLLCLPPCACHPVPEDRTVTEAPPEEPSVTAPVSSNWNTSRNVAKTHRFDGVQMHGEACDPNNQEMPGAISNVNSINEHINKHV